LKIFRFALKLQQSDWLWI